ncbi:MAG: DUF309 domain-containing protein [Roseobacter sp.]
MTEARKNVPLPPHVYIPGLSPRHPPQFFQTLKTSVHPAIPVAKLHETDAFKAGRAFYDAGFFWECHEVLEVIWMHTVDPSPERDMVLAFIQLANARLKVLMRQPRAALRLCDMVETHLARCPSDRATLGLDANEIRAWVKDARVVAKSVL